MARGWESKSVESQQTEGRPNKGGRKSADDVDRQQRRHTLEMSRRRVVSELANTKSPMRLTSLEAALKHLDEELSKL
ncbi:MAG TPA: hypothetical protein VL284_06730 [Thermoanaerobaculia bacterium]|nr:hypothetical protein [Thermoanaerobaculia bacterium]